MQRNFDVGIYCVHCRGKIALQQLLGPFFFDLVADLEFGIVVA